MARMVMMIWTCAARRFARWFLPAGLGGRSEAERRRASLCQARASADAMQGCGQGSCGHLSQARARASVAPRAATRCAALHRKQLCLAAAGTRWPQIFA